LVREFASCTPLHSLRQAPMADFLRRSALWVGSQGLRAAAPDWWTFTDRQRFTRKSRTQVSADAVAGAASKRQRPWGTIISCILSSIGWFWTSWKERQLRSAALLASATPLLPLAALRRALRSPLPPAPERLPPGTGAELGACAEARTPRRAAAEVCSQVVGQILVPISVHVTTLAGNTVWGPEEIEGSMLVADLQRRVAEAMGQSSFAVQLVYETKILDPSRNAVEEGLKEEVHITAIVSRDREEIADALFAHTRGHIWVPDGAFVLAPFSREHVAFYETQVIRLYDEWVTSWDRRRVKAGRPAGTQGRDDPGSDSEYEDVERSQWMPREEVLECHRVAAPRIFLDDGSGERALILPRDLERWALENSAPTYSETEAADRRLNAGAVLVALVATERERGIRREERCLRMGEEGELVGEACITEHGLVLREPRLPSEMLHRVDSEGLLGDRPSSLRNKAFAGIVLRTGQQSLEMVQLGRAKWWRIGKFLLGLLSLFLATSLGRRTRLAHRFLRALRSQQPRVAAVAA